MQKKKMLKPFLCFSLPRILRDRSFARTSDLDWGNYTLITYLLDYLCVFFCLPHNDICRSICFKLCLKPAICFEPHRSNAKYQRCVLLCINVYLCFLPLTLHHRPHSESSLERLFLSDSSCLEPHEKPKVWQVSSSACNSY